MHGRLWAEAMMEDIPTERTWTMIDRAEYQELLTLAFAKGFKEGMEYQHAN
jgi:hypothetical protein